MLAIAATGLATNAATQNWILHSVPAVPGASSVELNDIDGASPTDVWAVGNYTVGGGSSGTLNTLALHNDGSAWSIVPTPNPSGTYPGPRNSLNAVKAFAADDVWAAGRWQTTGVAGFVGSEIFVLHWDGSSWTPMLTTAASPNGIGHEILDIVGNGPDDVWFLGRMAINVSRSLAIHWNGSSFQFHLGPQPATAPIANVEFTAGAAVSSNDLWAVGGSINFLMTSPYLVHGDGTSWTIVPGATSGNLYKMSDIAAVATNDVWVLGEEQTASSYAALLWRWNGSAWSTAPMWGPGFYATCLHASPAGDLFAGGWNGVQRWDGAAWVAEATLPALAQANVREMGNAGGSVFAVGNDSGGAPFLAERPASVLVPPSAVVRLPCTGVAPPGSLLPVVLPRVGNSWVVEIGDPTNAAQLLPAQTLSVWLVSLLPASGGANPCGLLAPWGGYGGQPGELLVDASPAYSTFLDSPRLWSGPSTPAVHSVTVFSIPGTIGMTLFTQGALVEFGPTAMRLVLTEAVDFTIGS